MFRIIREVRPTWVVGENVAGIVRMGLDDVLIDLESEGYTCRTFIIPACGIGAQHRRDRVWVVAYSESNRPQSNTESRSGKKSSGEGVSAELSRIHGDQFSPNPNSTGSQRQQFSTRIRSDIQNNTPEPLQDTQKSGSRGKIESRVCGSADGFPAIVDAFTVAPWVSKEETGPGYKNRIKALGNAIVPQVVYQIFKAIDEIEKGIKSEFVFF